MSIAELGLSKSLQSQPFASPEDLGKEQVTSELLHQSARSRCAAIWVCSALAAKDYSETFQLRSGKPGKTVKKAACQVGDADQKSLLSR